MIYGKYYIVYNSEICITFNSISYTLCVRLPIYGQYNYYVNICIKYYLLYLMEVFYIFVNILQSDNI